MLQQILSNTPVWVWVLLAFLVQRGVQASRDREVSLRMLLILPLVMLGISLNSLAKHYGLASWPVMLWGSTMLLTGWVVAQRMQPEQMVRISADQYRLQGSWTPLVLMMTIFVGKYAENVALAIVPALSQQNTYVAISSLFFGALNGVFFARVWRVLMLSQSAKQVQIA